MRLPPIAPDELTPEQKPLHDVMRIGVGNKFHGFTTMRADGALLGPWGPWLHEPRVGAAIWGVTEALTQFRQLPDRVRQIVILVVGARFNAAYEIYAHTAVAYTDGLSEGAVSAILAGSRPSELSEDEGIAYDAARVLADGHVLPEPIYQKALAVFGKQGVTELIYLVGHYCFVSVTLNGFDVPVPSE